MRRNFRKDERGAAALEFSLVMIPFFGLIFAVFEIGYAAFMASALENAAGQASRMIRTGREDAPTTAGEFKNVICQRMAMPIAKCEARMTINVQTFASFDAISSWEPPEGDSYVQGGSREIQMVRATYRQPLMTPLFALYPRDVASNTIDLASTFAFRNEPFETGS